MSISNFICSCFKNYSLLEHTILSLSFGLSVLSFQVESKNNLKTFFNFCYLLKLNFLRKLNNIIQFLTFLPKEPKP